MCGINGILSLNGSAASAWEDLCRDQIKRMNDAITHRGPDGEGTFVQYPVALGHRRLSIIDLSNNAAQPMFNEDRTIVLVFNGEIYNYLELISDLKGKGYVFRSKSDTEAILHAYEEYGSACVERFNGMWSFVLYDFNTATLFASRDRLGVKPFYYYRDQDRFIFSSEIKGILEIKPIHEANHGKVYDYLAYGYKTSNGDTFFQNIFELPPAHNLTIKGHRFELYKYWDFKESTGQGPADHDLATVLEQFQSLLTDAIKLRFRSDVPVAILLSGGLDSTAITRIVDDLIEQRALDYTEVSAYSAVFPGYLYDESSAIQEFVGTCKHVQFQPVYPDGTQLVSAMENVVHGLGEPVFSATSFAHYSLMQEIKNSGVKVVMNGQGSDEAFCGYGSYLIGYFLLDALFSRPSTVAHQLTAIHNKLGYSYPYILAQILKAALPRRTGSYLRGKYQEGGIKCLAPDFVKQNYHYLKNSRSRMFSSDNLGSYLKLNIKNYGFNQILHYEDHSSMQHSIEIRSPFIDYRLMEFAFSIPTEFKFDMGTTKKLIRDCFAGRIPDSIIHNHRKIGFATPFTTWLKDDAFGSYISDILGSESFRSKRIWKPETIRAMFDKTPKLEKFPYWRILNLELWSRSYGITNL